MKFFRSLFLDNLGTKLMALILALLLWIYLYKESTDSDEFEAVFEPKILETGLASWQALTSDGVAIRGKISIKLTGPKGDLRGLSKKGIRCEPTFDRSLFPEHTGSFSRDLTVDDLYLPDGFHVVYRPSARITVKYVKYVTVKLKVVLPDPPCTGSPAPDFAFRSAKILDPPESDPRVDVRMPADRMDIKQIRLKPVSLNNSSRPFEVAGEADLADDAVRLLRPVRVDVRIEPETATLRITLPLSLAGDTAVTSRLELLTRQIAVDVAGPKSEVAAIERANHAQLFFAYVIAEPRETEMVKDNRIELKQIHCGAREKALKNRFVFTVMPEKSEVDRLVEVKVVR